MTDRFTTNKRIKIWLQGSAFVSAGISVRSILTLFMPVKQNDVNMITVSQEDVIYFWDKRTVARLMDLCQSCVDWVWRDLKVRCGLTFSSAIWENRSSLPSPPPPIMLVSEPMSGPSFPCNSWSFPSPFSRVLGNWSRRSVWPAAALLVTPSDYIFNIKPSIFGMLRSCKYYFW